MKTLEMNEKPLKIKGMYLQITHISISESPRVPNFPLNQCLDVACLPNYHIYAKHLILFFKNIDENMGN